MKSIARAKHLGSTTTISHDRNGTEIFAERTLKNLDFLVAAATAGKEVHPVTQAVSALLGICVFPWETSAFDIVKRRRLAELHQMGWPSWEATGTRRVVEVGELLEVLRNATSHGAIAFDNDSKLPDEVTVTFANTPRGAKSPDWVGQIRGDKLIEFCRRFVGAIRDQVG